MNQQSFLKAAAAYAAAAAAERDGASEQGEAFKHTSSSILDEEDHESSGSDGNWDSPSFESSSKDQPVRASFQSQNSWARQSMARVSIVNVSRAARSELSGVVSGSHATVDTGVNMHSISSEKSTPLRPVSSSPTQDVTLRQKAMAAFRNHWLMAAFVAVLVGLTVLTWFGIRSIYIDPAILTGRFLAATVIVCFSVFLFPFVRVVQGQMYDKLADFASFFNPHLHKALGVVLIAAGSFHGVLWNIATFRSCEGTWCPVQRQGYDDPLVHASCIRTFCHDSNLPFDAYARGSLPSFSAAFSTNVPLNLEQTQAVVRSFYYGYICMLLFVTIGIFTLPRIRRENFELFYYSHHLFILAIPVLFLHCWTVGTPSFAIQVMLIPCGIAAIVYGCDKLVSIFFRRHTSAKVDTIFYSDGRILELRFRPVPAWPKLTNPYLWFSNSNLILDAPVRCAFAPGMDRILHTTLWRDAFAGAYIDINCPAVSKFQWHPFTISSSPDADFVSVTMQVLPGGWTEQVANACMKLQDKSAESGRLSMINGEYKFQVADSPGAKGANQAISSRYGIQVPLHFNISGPFGAPSVAYQHYDCLVGIGGGIGFTPFMSILKDFLAEKRQRRAEGNLHSSSHLALFYGVCRNLDDVAWWSSLSNEPDFSDFVSSCSMAIGDPTTKPGGFRQSQLIRPSNAGFASADATAVSRSGLRRASIAVDLTSGFLGITLFCTGAKQEQITAAKAIAAPGVSVRPGRPRFDNIFKNIDRKLKTPSRVGVFVCGGDSLCNSVEGAVASSVGSRHEFVFHKEIFG